MKSVGRNGGLSSQQRFGFSQGQEFIKDFAQVLAHELLFMEEFTEDITGL